MKSEAGARGVDFLRHTRIATIPPSVMPAFRRQFMASFPGIFKFLFGSSSRQRTLPMLPMVYNQWKIPPILQLELSPIHQSVSLGNTTS